TYTLSGATPFVVETGNTVATDTATSAAIVGDNSNDWDLLIESAAAQQIGVSDVLMVAANTTGGVTGKMISPQSIAIACAAVGLVG
ncbi:L-lactate permease, partial [Salmonella enterica subsp. enterica serovar Kentucky]|nr:L-lactate permease [Salmonella enterica subsp. enterica serovar Kentucky]